MRPLNRQHSTIHNRLVTLLAKPKRRDLRKQVVEPSARARMRVCPGKRNIGLSIDRVLISHPLQRIKNTIANSRVSALRIKHDINKAVLGVLGLANDESARVQPLAQTASDLAGVRIPAKADLDNRAGYIGLSDTDQILVAEWSVPRFGLGVCALGMLDALG